MQAVGTNWQVNTLVLHLHTRGPRTSQKVHKELKLSVCLDSDDDKIDLHIDKQWNEQRKQCVWHPNNNKGDSISVISPTVRFMLTKKVGTLKINNALMFLSLSYKTLVFCEKDW